MQRKITVADIRSLFAKREKDANKGDFGQVGILGGSINYSGAIKLAYMSLSTLRSGAGLVRVIIPSDIIGLMPNLLEQTCFPYKTINDIKESIKGLDALAIGMGWSKAEEHLEILKYILENYEGNLVIDADGLNTLVGHLEWLSNAKAHIVLTPHLKEFSRLTNLSVKEINERKIEVTKDFAKKHHVTVLLKGHSTILTNGNDIYTVTCGTPGMATSGSGDVLSGILVGLLGYLEFNLLTMSAAVLLNGLAGSLAEEKYTDIAMIASDTVNSIPEAIKKIREEEI